MPLNLRVIRRARPPAAWLALLAMCALGCGGDHGGVGPGPLPARLVVAVGNGQRGVAGSAVPVAPAVLAVDADGEPVPGVAVDFTMTGGGGTVVPATVTTGLDGQAALETWNLGPGVGENTLRAAVGSAPAIAVEMTAEAVAGPMDPGTSSVVVSPRVVHTGERSTITVTARDALGNPVAGVELRVSATGAGNTVVQPPPTGATGSTAGTLASSTRGTKTVTVAAGVVTLSQQPVVVVEGDPVVTTVTVDPDESALLVGQAVRLTASVLDEQGRPMTEAEVEWSTEDAAVASVEPDGTVIARAPGTVSITAAAGGVRRSAGVTVSLGEGTLTGVTYCTIDGVQDKMDVYVPAASKPRPLPVAVHVHGGGWISGSRSTGERFTELKAELLERGYLVVSLDYRLAPTHKYPSQIEDVKCALRHLRARAARYGLNPNRIGAWGGSAGGQLVALLGTTDSGAGFDGVGGFSSESSRVQAVITISAITDFTRPDELHDDYHREFTSWPDPMSPEMIEASPVTHASGDDATFLLFVGEDDALVDNAQSIRLNQRLGSAGVPSSVLVVEHADHDLGATDAATVPSASRITELMAEFFDRTLR